MTKQERVINITRLEVEIVVAITDEQYEHALWLQEELNIIYNTKTKEI